MWEYNVDLLSVGDTFEGGPIAQNYFISAILRVGGRIAIDGSVVTILELPQKAKEVVSLVPEDTLEQDAYNEAVAIASLLIESPAPAPTRKSPGRPRKVKTEE